MVDSNLLVIFSFLQVFGNYPVFRKLHFKSIEEWLESSSTTGGNFQHCLHLLLGKQPQHKSFLTKLLEFCNCNLGNGTFRARQLHNCPSSLKMTILLGLLERQLVVNKQLKKFLNCGSEKLRVRPVGEDKHGNFYWFFMDRVMDMRIYRLHVNGNNEEWSLLAKDKESFEELLTSLEREVLSSIGDVESLDNASGAALVMDLPSCKSVDKPDSNLTKSIEMVQTTQSNDSDSEPTENPTKMFECKNCKETTLTPSASRTLNNHIILQSAELESLCPICKHKMLVDHLEERFFLYSESLIRLEAPSDKACNDIPCESITNKALHCDEETCSPVIPDSVTEAKIPESSLVPNTTNESIPDSSTSTHVCEAISRDFIMDDAPSSPSDFEDNEIKDPSIEFDLNEPTDEDDVDIKDHPPNRKKEKVKSKTPLCRHDSWSIKQNTQRKMKGCSPRMPKNNRQSPLSPWPVICKKAPRQRTSESDHNAHKTTGSRFVSPFGSQQHRTSQSLVSHPHFSAPISHCRKMTGGARHNQSSLLSPIKTQSNMFSKVGNSTTFVGKLARSKSLNVASFGQEKSATTSRTGINRYFSDGFHKNHPGCYEFDNEQKNPYECWDLIPQSDDANEDDVDDANEDEVEGDDEWAWEDYDETCNYEDYDYNYDNDDDQFEDWGPSDNIDFDTSKDDHASLTGEEVAYGCQESFTDCDVNDSTDVIHVINSDDEKCGDDYDDGKYAQKDSETYYSHDYDEVDYSCSDNYTNCDDIFDITENDDDACDESMPEKCELTEAQDFGRMESKPQERKTPEDDCFVVEVIE